MTSIDLQGKYSLVTGARGGIGGALVDALLEAGAARVYAAGRGALGDHDPQRVTPLTFDVTKEDEIAAAVAQVEELDLLINSAGTLTSLDLVSGDLSALERDLDVHVLGPVRVIRAFLPQLEQRGGAVVNILSVAALASIPGIEGSAASKAATFSLTQALRAQLSSRNVSVHAVFPGPVDTPLVEGLDIPKTPALDVARATLAAVAAGEEDIFPDPASHALSEVWGTGVKQIERQFVSTR